MDTDRAGLAIFSQLRNDRFSDMTIRCKQHNWFHIKMHIIADQYQIEHLSKISEAAFESYMQVGLELSELQHIIGFAYEIPKVTTRIRNTLAKCIASHEDFGQESELREMLDELEDDFPLLLDDLERSVFPDPLQAIHPEYPVVVNLYKSIPPVMDIDLEKGLLAYHEQYLTLTPTLTPHPYTGPGLIDGVATTILEVLLEPAHMLMAFIFESYSLSSQCMED
ncbi:hypothetical protein AC578_6224 [Pseudocercospora eumusae]|uniref:Uncharacterized protein n=1 Tax=Pseudocercospora eumusae TaxID=321146 RepID=A0A139H356_9PEZI|nr:hypothetical protein AC578_6224 [Pseudocercospora eumusae]